MKRLGWVAFSLVLCLGSMRCDDSAAQTAAVADKPAAAAVDTHEEDVPGVGPIRHEDWFEKLWRDRRASFAEHAAQQQHALVFLGDSITQGWGDDFRGKFQGV